MQLDRNALNKLLSMSDSQLEIFVQRLAEQYGLDLSSFRVKPGDVASLRRALRSASDEDLKKIGEQLKNGRSRS